MTWLNYQFHGIIGLLTGALASLFVWGLARRRTPKETTSRADDRFILFARVFLILLGLGGFVFVYGAFYFDDLDPPTCTSVTVRDVAQKTYQRNFQVDRFVVEATRTAVEQEKKNASIFGIRFTPRTSWLVDVEDTSLDAGYRGAAVLTQRYGRRSRKTHFGLELQCPQGAAWDAR